MIMGISWPDLLLVAVTLCLAVALPFARHKDLFRRAATLLAGLLALQLLLVGVRWQVLPAYLATIVLLLALWSPRRWLRYAGACITLTLAAVAVVASWAFPVFSVPDPGGSYAVGSTRVFLTDESRDEDYTDDADDKRRLALRIWYPSDDPESGTKLSYFVHPGQRSRAITHGTPLPWFTFTHLGKVGVGARADASIAEGQFPVLIYSHGLGIGWSSGNTPLVEHLASHGYIVVAIGHSYIGSSVIFPDGVALFDPATRAAMNTQPPEEVMEVYRQVKDISEPGRQLDVYMQAMRMMPESIKGRVDLAMQNQVDDQAFVLDSLASLASDAVDLGAHADLSNVGVFGMSIGGSAAIITCSSNPACGAVVNLDGFHPDQAGVELGVPSLALHRSDNLLVQANYDRAQADAFLLEITDATHFNFFDFALMSPLYRELGVLGPLDGAEGLEVQRDYVTAFFDAYLKGKPAPLMSGSAHASANASLKARQLN